MPGSDRLRPLPLVRRAGGDRSVACPEHRGPCDRTVSGAPAPTISHELRRNASTRSYHLEYRAWLAQWHAERRARRPQTAKLVAHDRLREYVQDRLAGTVAHATDGRAVATDGGAVAGPQVPPWQGRNRPRRQDRRRATAWSPERISRRTPAETLNEHLPSLQEAGVATTN